MKVTVLIIHGAGVRSFRIMSERWLPYLKSSLGKDFDIICPQMPSSKFPKYTKWRAVIKKSIANIKGPLILIGHSLGGTILLKYLTEESIPNRILGLYLIASPYFSSDQGWNYQDFFIHKNPTELLSQFPLYSYHSTDDAIVPVSHQGYIVGKFPQMVVRTLSGHGHEFDQKEFKEIIQDIKQLQHFDLWPSATI